MIFSFLHMIPCPDDSIGLSNGNLEDEHLVSEEDIITISEEDLIHGDDYITSALADLEKVRSKGKPARRAAKILDHQPDEDFSVEVSIDDSEEDVHPASAAQLYALQTEIQNQQRMIREMEKLHRSELNRYERMIRDMKTQMEELDKKSQDADKKADEFKQSWIRVSADYQNFQKRSKLKLTEFIEIEYMNLLREVLPIIENLKRSLTFEGELNSVMEGVRLIYKQFEDLLMKWNVKEILSLGEVFNPVLHDATFRVISDSHPENTILEVISAGYYYKDKVLRPAKVIVSYRPKKEEKAASPDADSVSRSDGSMTGEGTASGESGIREDVDTGTRSPEEPFPENSQTTDTSSVGDSGKTGDGIAPEINYGNMNENQISCDNQDEDTIKYSDSDESNTST